jgi:tRNA(Ile)-lysidine synthase
MIKLLGNVPRKVTIALSGGIDSMVLLDFLSRNHEVEAAFFNHGTENSERAEVFVTDYCTEKNITLHKGKVFNVHRGREQSPEEHWREERYNFLNQFPIVVTAHHLDDVAETWVWSSLHGTSSLIPYRRGNVIRPFLLNRKYDLEDWARRKNVKWINDTSNDDIGYTRNYIRHELMAGVLRVNPGIHTMLRKKLEERQKVLPNDLIDK